MKRRTRGILLVGGLAVAMAVTMVVVLAGAPARGLDPDRQCETGFSTLIDCHLSWSSRSVSQSTPIFTTPPDATTGPQPRARFEPGYHDQTLWAVAHCPQNALAKRLLCAVPSAAAKVHAASDDLATGLPLPKPWVLRTANNSPFINSLHVETPLDLAAALGFWRAALSQRGWSENDGALVGPDRAVIAFTTSDGPALLRVIHQNDRTIADLALHKRGDVALADILPRPGQARLMLGNESDEEAVITINALTITLAPRAKLQDGGNLDLPPGQLKVTLRVASSAEQDRTLELGANETWGLSIGPAGIPLPMQLY